MDETYIKKKINCISTKLIVSFQYT